MVSSGTQHTYISLAAAITADVNLLKEQHVCIEDLEGLHDLLKLVSSLDVPLNNPHRAPPRRSHPRLGRLVVVSIVLEQQVSRFRER